MTRVPAPSEAHRAPETPTAPPAPRAPETDAPAQPEPQPPDAASASASPSASATSALAPVAPATSALAPVAPAAHAPEHALPAPEHAPPAPEHAPPAPEHAPPAPAAPEHIQPAPAAPEHAAPSLAARWRRLLAFMIDAVILTLATGALWGRLLASFANRMSQAAALRSARSPAAHGAYGRVFGHTIAPYLIVLVPTIVVAVLYYWLLTGYWGTTIGKRILGTWVVRASDHSWAGLRLSFVRAVVFVAGGEILPLFFLADNLWLTGDPRRQALHDKAARTLVVTTRPAPPRPAPPSPAPPRPGRGG